MRDMWKLYWGRIILLILLAVMVGINFRWGYFVLGNDNYSPEENPTVSFERYLYSPTWREYRGLGVPSDSEQIDLFRSGLFLVLEKMGMPLWFVSQMSVWLVFVLGSLGMGWLCYRFLKKEESFLAGGIIYLSSLLTLWLFFSPLKPFIFFWGFLPFFLAATDSLLEKESWDKWFVWFIGLIGLSSAYLIPTLFFVTLLVFLSFCIYWYLKKVSVKRLLGLFLVFLVWQMYWLIPFGWYVKNQSGQLQDSFINRGITSGTIQDEKQYNTFFNVAAGITSWLNVANDDGEKLFKFGQEYQSAGLRLVGLLPFVLAVLGVILAIRKKDKPLVWLGVVMMGGIWLIKGSNPPFGFLYEFMVDKIPLFAQVFRWGSSKFWPLMWIPLVLLATYGWLRIKMNENSRLAAGVILGLMVGYIFPVFGGKLINDRDWVKIPKEYYDLRNYLEREDKVGRVYLAPEANMLYFRNHDWGFFGSVFWSYWIPNPIVEKALVTGSAENEEAYKKLVNMYYSAEPELFVKVLNNYQIKWLISDRSLSNQGNGYKYNWENHTKVVDENPLLEKVWNGGKLELYRVKESGRKLESAGEKGRLILSPAKPFGKTVIEIKDGYRIENKNSMAGIYWDISNPEISDKVLKISAKVKNESGIVAEVNLRETKKEYQTFSYLGKMGEAEEMTGYVYLPKEWRNYLLEVVVKARGPDMSVNEISNIKIEMTPIDEAYFKANFPDKTEWERRKIITYLGLGLNLTMVFILLTRQILKSSKTVRSGSNKTTKA